MSNLDKQGNFFALIGRMRYIKRWSLMRVTEEETIEGHSYQTAVIAHALCVIAKKIYHEDVDPERASLLALYHDVQEILTGDMPTPVKYHNAAITGAYKEIENESSNMIYEMLPDEISSEYDFLKNGEREKEWAYVKAADTLSAYIKCKEEVNNGNNDFKTALETIESKISKLSETNKALRYFLDHFIDQYTKTLDELK